MFISGIHCDTPSSDIRVGVFNVDVSPPLGSPVAYAKTRSIQDPLRAKGIVLLSDKKPVVLCAIDWLGIANEGQDAWRKSLAQAAGTTIDRVSVHTVHQHDGCRCDFTTEAILEDYELRRRGELLLVDVDDLHDMFEAFTMQVSETYRELKVKQLEENSQK